MEPEPVVEQPRMSLRDHRRAERQRAMANGLEIAKPVPGRGPSRRRRDAWLRRGPRARTRGGRSARRSRRSGGGARHRRPRAGGRPTRSRAPSAACAWPSPTRGAPTPRWTRTSSAAAAAAPARRLG